MNITVSGTIRIAHLPPDSPAPSEYGEISTSYVECANCGRPIAYLLDYGGPPDAPFHYKCMGCEKHFFLAEASDEIPEMELEEEEEEEPATTHGPMMPYYCAECSGGNCVSSDYEKKTPLPHRWGCKTCLHRWTHDGTYIEPAPEKAGEPGDDEVPKAETPVLFESKLTPTHLRSQPCPGCGTIETECTNTMAPHGEPRHWRCAKCSHEFTISDGWE